MTTIRQDEILVMLIPPLQFAVKFSGVRSNGAGAARGDLSHCTSARIIYAIHLSSIFASVDPGREPTATATSR
jgi:hypothetical protein